jgi:hypothetical protein
MTDILATTLVAIISAECQTAALGAGTTVIAYLYQGTLNWPVISSERFDPAKKVICFEVEEIDENHCT